MQAYPEQVPAPLPPQPAYQSPLPRLIWVLVVLLIVLLLPSLVERVQYALTRGREQAQADVARGELAEHKLDPISHGFALVAKAVGPSVVHINTVSVIDGGYVDEWASIGRPQQYQARGEGSGFIVDANGYVLTNNHVIKDAEQIQVTLSDGRSLSAEVIGADPPTDVAVLKINADKLTACVWGDSDKLETGNIVFAIGNPYGLDRSVTSGIISATNRRASQYQDFLQTDAAINPGNSGGPLVNVDGEVIGINTAIIGQVYQGIGFALHSNTAHEVYDRLKSTGKVARGWLGASLKEPNEADVKKFGIKPGHGALVDKVLRGAPAEKAGIEPGDLVIQWNGQPVADATTLSLLVAKTAIGSTAKVVLIREGKEMTLNVTIEERPDLTKRGRGR